MTAGRRCRQPEERSDPNRAEERATSLPGGSVLAVRLEEYVGHAGRLRIAFDPDIVAALKGLTDRPRGIVAEAEYKSGDMAVLSPEKKRELSNLLHFERSQPDFVSWRVAHLPHAAPYLCRTIGRLPVMATLGDLQEQALIEILTRPKNALAKQYMRMFEMEGVKLRFQEEALHAIAKRAILRKTGARGLRSILEGILLETMFELPTLTGVQEVVITADVVDGKARPLYTYSDKAEAREKSAS